MLNGWRQFALLSATFAAMLLTANLFSKSEAKHERQPKTELSSGLGTPSNSPAQSEAARSCVSPMKGPMPVSATNPAE
jgi:hypothetical protein